MTRRRMLLLIIGSLITVSTAVGVGVNFATANGSSQESSSLKGIDTSSPIIRDGEETKVIDKEKDKSPSTPPAKVEINDKRKVSQTQTKDKQEPAKQTTPPTNSPVIVRKEGGTSNTNNKGTQLIIGDTSKLNLPQENKEESKDSKPKPAVVIIQDSPTPPPTQEVKKNEEQSGSSKQNSTDAPVVVAVQPQPQKTSPQEKKEEKEIANNSNEQQTQGESSRQGSEVQVEAPKGQKDNQGETSNKQEEQETKKLESSEQSSQSIDQSPAEVVNLIDSNQNQEQQPVETQPKLTEQETRVLTTISEFNKIKSKEDLDKFMDSYTVKPEDEKTFFANIPKEWIRDANKQADLRTFWIKNKYNVSEGLAKDYWTTPWGRDEANVEFNKYLRLADTGELNGKIISAGNSFIVKGVPKPFDPNKP